MIDVAKELNMTEEDLAMFTPPKAIFYQYQRQLIYNMTIYQIKLFNNVVRFEDNTNKQLEKKKQ